MNKPRLQLVGKNGNAYAVLSRARLAARRAGWTEEEIKQVIREATSGDYDHLLQTMMKHFDVS